MSRIAFLGLGAMASRIVLNLIKIGHTVTVWNRDATKAEALASGGALIAASPRTAAEGAEVVFSMVTDDKAARSVWLDPAVGAVQGLARSAIAIECSTVTPGWIRALGDAVDARGARLLDAPVAGSLPQAENGQLIFIVGGEPGTLETVRSVLQPLASAILHVGALGQGSVLKLAVNALFATQLQSLAEVLGYLARSGFEPADAAAWLAQFPIVAPPIAGAARMMADRKNTPLFTIDLMEKDLRYIIETADSAGVALPGAANARAAFQAAQAMGLGHANITALASVYAPE